MSEIKARLEERIGREIRHNESLSAQTLLKENTIAEFFLEVEAIEDLVKAAKAAIDLNMPVVVLGNGSQLYLPDETILGLVIKNNCRSFAKMGVTGKQVLIHAESGTPMNQLVRFTLEEGLEGLEYFLGMPGTVGGALYTDIKYKRTHVRDSLQAVEILTKDGKRETHMQDLEKHIAQGIVLSAVFRLLKAGKNALWERAQEASEYRTRYNKK
jgi:UDP-N-acetylmuramate dehydrogenase